MRKTITILFLICANLVLMVHAIVPHHHHDSIACFIMPVEEDHNDDCCAHHEEDHQQKHATDHSNDCCVLNDLLAIIPHQFKPEYYDFDVATKFIYSDQFNPIIQIPDADQERLIIYKDYRQRPFQSFSYELFATHCMGMRAPPSC